MARSIFSGKVVAATFLAIVPFLSFSQASATTKLKYAIGAYTPPNYLIPLAAEEHAIWKKHALEVTWLHLRGDVLMFKGVTAGEVDAGTTAATAVVPAAAQGVPVVIVAPVLGHEDFFFWVRTKGRVRAPEDMKGAKIAVSSLGGTLHVYGLVAATGLGLRKDIKFVATGGPRESLAAFTAGSVDGMVTTLRSMLRLKLAGEAKALVNVQDYLPKEWAGRVLFVSKPFLSREPDGLRRLVGAVAEAMKIISTNRDDWTVKKLKSVFGNTDEEARIILKDSLVWGEEIGISRKELENVADFLVLHGIIQKEQRPPLERYFMPVLAR